MKNPAADMSVILAERNEIERKRAALKGALRFMEDARWLLTCSGLLLGGSVGIPVDHPAAQELARSVGALGLAVEAVAALEVAADRKSGGP
jgi:hypothetical protein